MSVRHDVFSNKQLLTPPSARPAWSDRTALFMAEMSKIAYYNFELNANNKVMPPGDLDEVLRRLQMPGDTTGETSADAEDTGLEPALPAQTVRLKETLAKAGFELAGLFSDEKTDTQAFLAISNSDSDVHPFGNEKVAILSFRGTRTKRDWLTNVKFFQRDAKVTAIHSGFQESFDSVKEAIRAKLDPLVEEGRAVFVTGHSLGGALAIIATRSLAPDSHGACYTFGSPRVGRYGFSRDIKTPMYRVVNSNDIVPRVPAAYLPYILLVVLKVLNVPAFGLLKRQINKITFYVHYGDLRFIRRAKSPDDDIKVLSNPSELYRFVWYWRALAANLKSPVKNHDINLYCEKLAAYAVKRNNPQG